MKLDKQNKKNIELAFLGLSITEENLLIGSQ